MADGEFAPTCPIPIRDYPAVLLAHGGGGRLMGDLVQRLFLPAFRNSHLEARHDGAVLELDSGERLAFTTDSYVVDPLFFPGGDIGKLAVVGTVNDLAVAGALPRFVSCALILEEGLPTADLERVLDSMRRAAAESGVEVVTGDTKVVPRGKADRLFINTAGVGELPERPLPGGELAAGDVVIVSGTIGKDRLTATARIPHRSKNPVM